jgi:uncharacterized protein involved in exopolysaccharide biosynthesis
MEQAEQSSETKALRNWVAVDGHWAPAGMSVPAGNPGAGFFVYLEILKPWRRTIIATTVAMAAATLLLTGLALPRWYEATAVIRSASQEPNTFQQLGINATGINSMASSLGSVMGLATNDTDSQEYISILNSFNFTTAVARQHGLSDHFRPSWPRQAIRSIVKAVVSLLPSGEARTINPDWDLYKLMNSRFRADFDHRTGNVNLSFLDKSPEMARTILGYYIGDLRTKLQLRITRYSRAASRALEQEIAATQDPTLRIQLDEILATQLQQEKTAAVQADFAFTVIEPPVIPNSFSRPTVLLDSLAVLILTPILLAGLIVFREQLENSYARFKMQTAATSSNVHAHGAQTDPTVQPPGPIPPQG